MRGIVLFSLQLSIVLEPTRECPLTSRAHLRGNALFISAAGFTEKHVHNFYKLGHYVTNVFNVCLFLFCLPGFFFFNVRFKGICAFDFKKCTQALFFSSSHFYVNINFWGLNLQLSCPQQNVACSSSVIVCQLVCEPGQTPLPSTV